METDAVAVEKGKLMKTVRIFMIVVSFVFVALFFLLLQGYKTIAGQPVDRSTISVQGTAERFVAPDIAVVSFSITEEAKTVAKAQEVATEKSNAASEFLLENDVEKKDIKTTSYNVYPKYEYVYENNGVRCLSNYCPPPYERKQNLIGYEVTQSTQVKIRDLDSAGTLISGLGEIGVGNVGGLNFQIEDREAVVEEVKNEAIADARAKAKERAKSLGVRLGKILSVNDGGGYYYDDYARGGVAVMESMAMDGKSVPAAPAPTIDAGENQVVSNVNIVFEIK